MFRSCCVKGTLVLAMLSVQGTVAQVVVGPWTLTSTPGQSFGAVVQCATNAPAMVAGTCATLKAVSKITGNAPFGSSSCIRFLTATTTVTVGPASTSVLFSGNLVGFMEQQSMTGGLCLVAAFLKLDGGVFLDCNPLGPGVSSPPAPLPVSTLNSRAVCLNPGTHTLAVTLNTYATNQSGIAAQATTVDFFNVVAGVARGFTVCVTDQGTCTNNECGLPTPVVLGINPLFPAGGNTFTNVGATTSPGYPAICAAINSDVWFAFMPPSPGLYRFDTNPPYTFAPGTLADTVIAVYASCAPVAPLACDNDSGFGSLSSVTVNLNLGTVYYVRVGGFGAAPPNQGSFYLTVVRLMTLTLSSPFGPGSLQVNVSGGPPSGSYYTALALSGNNFPNAPFFGIDLTLADFAMQFSAGYPFTGALDSSGNASYGPFAGIPSGLSLYGVVIGLEGLPGIVSGASAPVSYVVP